MICEIHALQLSNYKNGKHSKKIKVHGSFFQLELQKLNILMIY